MFVTYSVSLISLREVLQVSNNLLEQELYAASNNISNVVSQAMISSMDGTIVGT